MAPDETVAEEATTETEVDTTAEATEETADDESDAENSERSRGIRRKPKLNMGTLQDTLEQLRSEIKAVGSTVKFTSDAIKGRDPNIEGEDKGEMIANTILAFRHLEDAAMRLGKTLQAMNGGVSIFDKK